MATKRVVRARYYVETHDPDKERFTPHKGVRRGPYSLFGLRKAIRKLQAMGYPCDRQDPSVSVWREPYKEGRNVRFGAYP